MNILLPVSRDPSFADALRLAVETAKAHDGKVRVLATVDQGEIRRIEKGARPGAIHLARHAAEEVEKRLVAEGTAAVREATRDCAAAGVPVQGEVREGEPEKEFLAAAGGCDLLVSSVASHFAPDLEDPPGRLVLSLMKDGTIPVLLAGASRRPAHTVVVGCGGGWDNFFKLGLTFDTRDFEADPSRGFLLQSVAELANKGLGSEFTYERLNFSFAGYQDLIPGKPRLVLAGRFN